jgi:hypothetical protein
MFSINERIIMSNMARLRARTRRGHHAGRAALPVAPALFLTTKLEAFNGRSGGDIFMSHDLEDIIAVIDGRPELGADIATAPAPGRRQSGTAWPSGGSAQQSRSRPVRTRPKLAFILV